MVKPAVPGRAGIDPNVPRFNQGATGLLLVVAFVVGLEGAVPVLGLILALGALFGLRANLWGQLYLRVVKPVFRIGPPTKRKDPAPPRFAQLLGAVFLAASSVALLVVPGATAALVGWILALVVAALALLAAITNLCVGCEIYSFVLRARGRDDAGERTG